MSTISSLIRQLKQQGIQVRLNGDDIQLSAASGDIDAAVLADVSASKPVLIEYVRKSSRQACFTAIPQVKVGKDYVLSSTQRRLWVLSRLDSESTAYHMPGKFFFRGEVDEQAMENAFRMLVERHEILRTVFREDEMGEPREVVLPATEAGVVRGGGGGVGGGGVGWLEGPG